MTKRRVLDISSPKARFSPRRGATFEELARQQGVRPVRRLEDLLGGWPEDELNDGFEEALAAWRQPPTGEA